MKLAFKDFLIGIIVTVLGGLLLYFIQKDLDKKPIELVIIKDTTIEKMRKVDFWSSIEYIKEQFGAPHRYNKYGDGYSYRYDFDQFSLDLKTDRNNVITIFTVILKDLSKSIFILPKGTTPSLELGKSTFSDLKQNSPIIYINKGARTFQYYSDYYFGYVGGYLYYRIGINGIDYPDSSSLPFELDSDSIGNDYIGKYKVNYFTAAREKDDLPLGGVY